MSLLKRDNRRPAPPREAMDSVRNGVGWALDVRIDENRLDGDEQRELLSLAGTCRAGAGVGAQRFDPTQLSRKERSRFEELVEKAASAPGLFAGRRDEAEMRTKVAELALRARKSPPQPRFEREGAVVLPPEVFADLKLGALWLEDIAFLAYVLWQWGTGGNMLPPRARIEPDGSLVFNITYGHLPAAVDPENHLRAKASLDNLVRTEWLTVVDGVRVSPGPRLRAAMKARAA